MIGGFHFGGAAAVVSVARHHARVVLRDSNGRCCGSTVSASSGTVTSRPSRAPGDDSILAVM